MSTFGDQNQQANDLVDLLSDMIAEHGIEYTLEYIGRSLSWLASEFAERARRDASGEDVVILA